VPESLKGKLSTLLIIAGFVTLGILVVAKALAAEMDLEQFRWKNRLLIVFAPDCNYPLLENLRQDLSASKGEVDDRDLVVLEILADRPSKIGSSPLSPCAAESLRKRFGVSPKSFCLILVGKDGGVKLKRNDAVKLEEIFKLIDSMPMRRDEMRQKGQSF